MPVAGGCLTVADDGGTGVHGDSVGGDEGGATEGGGSGWLFSPKGS